MRPSKLMIVAVALVFALFGVTSLIAKDGNNPRQIQKPGDDQTYADPPPLEGDPWQDDDGGGSDLTSGDGGGDGGGWTDVWITPNILSSFGGFRMVFIKVLPPAKKAVKKTSMPKNSAMKKKTK
jgi:hypothetical protein